MEKQEKYMQYAAMITGVIGEMLNGENDFSIDTSELEEGKNLTHFIHALANVAPSHIYNQLTGDNKNNLQFNHVANQLCFQYSKKTEE